MSSTKKPFAWFVRLPWGILLLWAIMFGTILPVLVAYAGLASGILIDGLFGVYDNTPTENVLRVLSYWWSLVISPLIAISITAAYAVMSFRRQVPRKRPFLRLAPLLVAVLPVILMATYLFSQSDFYVNNFTPRGRCGGVAKLDESIINIQLRSDATKARSQCMKSEITAKEYDATLRAIEEKAATGDYNWRSEMCTYYSDGRDTVCTKIR